jgi:anti-sigma regulatory factor (Ser/Thr protein kinase)
VTKRQTRRGEEIRRFLLKQVTRHPQDLVKAACENFEISRQAVARYVRELVSEGYLDAKGSTRQRRYSLKTLEEKTAEFVLEDLEENEAWRSEIRNVLGNLPENIADIWHYGFTEMVNNAIDHSGCKRLIVDVRRTAVGTRMAILDDGIGIFKKIKDECGLEDERHAVLELAKGKLTTDPEKHTGEGIFFTSRMFDDFVILSGDVYFSHLYGKEEDWIMEQDRPSKGTGVFMGIENEAKRKTQDIFEQFTSEEDDYGFTKTVVPVRMARQGTEKLISRSQAKRLLARMEKFNTVIFDFQDVEYAGRAFIDEIFRVFDRSHPNIIVHAINTSDELEKMIAVAQSVTR